MRVGTDLVSIPRMRESCKKETFVRRVFSIEEREFLLKKRDPVPSMAANWAAKEAFAKALGTGVRGFELSDVSVLRDELGGPYIKLSGKAAELLEAGCTVSVSLTHERDYAGAVVIIG